MRKSFLIFFTFLLASFTTISHAGLLIEPLVGWNFTAKTSTSDKNYSSGDGYGYGGRLGYKTGAMSLGFDYLKSEIDMSSGDFDKKITEEDMGLFLGYKLPALFKLYGTYIFSATGDTEITDRKTNLENGTGYKFGVGFTLLPFLDINLDYRKVGFNKDIAVDTTMLSVSLPFDLFN